MGVDLTSKTLCGVFGEAGQAALLEHFGDIRDRRLIGFIASAVATAGREFMFTKVIELPLGNEEGEVRQILHAMVPAKRPER